MQYPEISHKRVSDLTVADVQILLASSASAPAVMLCTDRGILTSYHPSGAVHPSGLAGVLGLGTVAWIGTAGVEPGSAWCALQAWSAGLSTAPESIRALIAISRLLPVVCKHVRDLLPSDVAIAQEYAFAKNYNAIEFDINTEGLISGTYRGRFLGRHGWRRRQARRGRYRSATPALD